MATLPNHHAGDDWQPRKVTPLELLEIITAAQFSPEFRKRYRVRIEPVT